MPPPPLPSEIMCVFKMFCLSDEGIITDLIHILINEN